MKLKKELDEQKYINRNILFSTCALVDDKIYSFTNCENLPIIMELSSKKIIFLDNLINYKPFIVDGMICDRKDIFVFSLDGKRLMKFNVYERTCQYYDIDCHEKDWGNYAAFARYGKYLYIFPKYKDMLVRVDVELGVVTQGKYVKLNQKEKVFFSCGYQAGSIVWLLHMQGDLIVAYNLEQDNWQKYKLPIKINDGVHIVEHNNMLYILSSEGNIYCWNILENSIRNFADCSKWGNGINEFSKIVITDKIIYLLPALGENILIMSLDGKIDLYHSYPKNFQYYGPEGWYKYYGYCENEDYYFFAMRTATFILRIGKRDGKVQWITPKLPLYKEYIKVCMWYRGILQERETCLNKFFICINSDFTSFLNHKYAAGNQIWEKLKNI